MKIYKYGVQPENLCVKNNFYTQIFRSSRLDISEN